MIKLLYQTPLSIAVNAGRTCWQSQDKGGCYLEPTNNLVESDKQFLNRILCKHKHGSVAEHIRFVFETLFENTEGWYFFHLNKYSFVKHFGDKTIVSTNLRVILDMKNEIDKGNIQFIEVFTNLHDILGKDFEFLFNSEKDV